MGAVIKSQSPTPAGIPTPHAAAFQFDDLANKAERYVQEVRKKAAEIVAQAQADAINIRSDAMEQGRRSAVEAAKKSLQGQFDQQVQTVIPALKEVALQVADLRHAWAKSWETSLVKLAIAIAERTIRAELRRRPEIPVDLAREAIDLVSGALRVRVLLNPQDHAALAQQWQSLAVSLADAAPVEFVADPSIAPGGCKAVTEHGSVDHQIESQLKRIEDELLA